MTVCNKEHAAPGYGICREGVRMVKSYHIDPGDNDGCPSVEFYMRFQTPLNFRDFQTPEDYTSRRKLYAAEIRLV